MPAIINFSIANQRVEYFLTIDFESILSLTEKIIKAANGLENYRIGTIKAHVDSNI